MGCTDPLTNRGSQYDWLRYGWDMLTDEDVPIEDFVQIADNANPDSWDPKGGTWWTTLDDPIVRWYTAADGLGYLGAHEDQADNGLDH
jgi:hypothetical protein